MIKNFTDFLNEEKYENMNSLYKLKLYNADFTYDAESSKDFSDKNITVDYYIPKAKNFDRYRIKVTYKANGQVIFEITDEEDKKDYIIYKKYYNDKKSFERDFLEVTDKNPD